MTQQEAQSTSPHNQNGNKWRVSWNKKFYKQNSLEVGDEFAQSNCHNLCTIFNFVLFICIIVIKVLQSSQYLKEVKILALNQSKPTTHTRHY